jgi:hypothetical protein
LVNGKRRFELGSERYQAQIAVMSELQAGPPGALGRPSKENSELPKPQSPAG